MKSTTGRAFVKRYVQHLLHFFPIFCMTDCVRMIVQALYGSVESFPNTKCNICVRDHVILCSNTAEVALFRKALDKLKIEI